MKIIMWLVGSYGPTQHRWSSFLTIRKYEEELMKKKIKSFKLLY